MAERTEAELIPLHDLDLNGLSTAVWGIVRSTSGVQSLKSIGAAGELRFCWKAAGYSPSHQRMLEVAPVLGCALGNRSPQDQEELAGQLSLLHFSVHLPPEEVKQARSAAQWAACCLLVGATLGNIRSVTRAPRRGVQSSVSTP